VLALHSIANSASDTGNLNNLLEKKNNNKSK
jgi:hypothetical protein